MTACDWLFLSFNFFNFLLLLLLDLSALVLSYWFAGMGGQGFRDASVSMPLCLNIMAGRILNFQLGTSCICGKW